jgi:two-component system, chemotaxis family, sensor kinase Cph1
MVIDFQAQGIDITRLKEPAIHTFNQIQPHGILIVLAEPDLTILQISSNAIATFGIAAEQMLQRPLSEFIDPFQLERIQTGLTATEDLDIINPVKLWVRKKGDEYSVFDGVFHRNIEGFLILELEPALAQENIPFLSFYHLARASINRLEETSNLREFCQIIVQEVRNVTGFDRVMLYKFDNDGHGSVIAEEKLDSMEPYLGLHFPESDIPRPARKLFASNWIRLIPDSHCEPVTLVPAINPISKEPTELTNSILRSAAACHFEYLHNMGVGASLTISLIKDQKLWGLIACHHQTPMYVSYELRKACEFLGRMVFSEIASREETEDFAYRRQLAYVQSALVEYMSQEENFVDGLIKHKPNLLNLADAQGAAICFGNTCTTIGKTPVAEDLNFLVQWLKNNVQEEVFYTDSLAQVYPNAERFKHVASGLLAIPISKRNYVLWFRPEVIQTVNWGGDPHNAYELNQENGLRLCPRKSFQLWQETVSLTSLPWKQVEIKAALELRKAIVNIVLRQADELAQLAADLERSNAELKKFAYVASHDLQEPLNQVANYVQLLEMRYQSQLDADAKEFINFAVEGVSLMQTLIDDVLAYSKVEMQGVEFELTEVDTALDRALGNLRQRITESGAKISRDPLPTVMADSTQLMQLFQNLIGNAIKFRSDKPLEIHISAQRQEEDEWLFAVRDNGMGIEPQFSDRIFVIFQRLHPRDEYPGTGMGLAICKKIVECHRGRIWVESQLGAGATFYFTLPVGGRDRERRNGRKAQNDLFGRGQ